MAALNVSVVSAEKKIWSGEAVQVVARTTEGEIGILKGHEPFLAVLQQGEVRVTIAGDEKFTVNAEGGFISVDHDVVTIVASQAALAQ